MCLKSRFKGQSSRIFVNEDNPFEIVDDECSCNFDVGYWNWDIPTIDNYLLLSQIIWTEILVNVTWDNSSIIDAFLDSQSRRLLDTDTDCYNVYVTECESNECNSAPVEETKINILRTVGQTFDNWTDITAGNVEYCFCYWMYYECIETTSGAPTRTPSMEPTTASPTDDPTVFVSTEEPEEIYEAAVGWAEDNYLIAGAIAIGAGCGFLLLCLLCCKRCKNKKKAVNVKNQNIIIYIFICNIICGYCMC